MGPLAMQHGGSRVVAPPDGEEAPHQTLQEEVLHSCEVIFFCFVFDGLLWFLFLWFVFLYGLLCPCFLDGGHTSFLCCRSSISCLLPASCLWLGQCVDKCIERLHFGMRLSQIVFPSQCARCERIGEEGDLCTRAYFHQGGTLHSTLSLLEGEGA